jgi:predicted PurR-regulated permease PerM
MTLSNPVPKPGDAPSAPAYAAQIEKIGPRGSWWWRATAGGAGLAFGVLTLAFFYYLARPLALLVLGVSLAAAVAPLLMRLETRLPRILAIVLIFLLFLILVILMGLFVIPTLVSQAQTLITQAPALIRTLQSWVSQISWLSSGPIPGAATSQLGALAGVLVGLPIAIFSSLFDLVVVIFIALYWLVVTPGMHQFVRSLFPEERREEMDLLLADMGSAMGGYIRGTAINGLIVGVLSYIGLFFIGVPYPSVLALVAGIMELIPVLGPIIGGALMVAFALLNSPTQALITLVFVIVLQQTENHILVPNIMRSQTNVSPLLAILALLAGSELGGLLGALVAIPLAGALTAFVSWVVAPAIRRQTGAAAIEVGIEEK